MADMQAGIGPFLGVFLIAHGWATGMIGTVMTIGGIAGMLLTAPAGAFVDASRRKRLFIIVPGVATVLASGLILLSQSFWVVSLSQVSTAVAGAAIGPAMSGLTLGLVGQRGFNRQLGRNQAFNHAGNVVGAALSGFLGWKYGLPAVFWLAAAFGVVSLVAILSIPADAIDDGVARGMSKPEKGEARASGYRVLVTCRPLLILAACLLFFHLGNAAMISLYGMAVSSAKAANPAVAVALTMVVSQGVMIVTSLLAMRVAEKRGYWVLLLISFLALPIRGALAAAVISQWGIYPVQLLDGIGAGIQSVAIPGLVARILDGTGRVNAGQGSIMTAQAFGASLSPALGGWLAQELGYPPMFLILGSLATVSLVLWVWNHGALEKSCKALSAEKAAKRKTARFKQTGAPKAAGAG
ncbi:MAG TPA: MFS transporter [Alphaproteobacteria bacterium]|nr:MFS transporter [Alphaproteobacteria bacterium]